MKKIKQIEFQNKKRPKSDFDILKLEELLNRDVQYDITQPHKIEFFHILFITQGQGFHTIDFTDYKYRKGTLEPVKNYMKS